MESVSPNESPNESPHESPHEPPDLAAPSPVAHRPVAHRPVAVDVDPDLDAADVIGLLDSHLADMRAVSPPESVHALDLEALRSPAITFCTARDAERRLLGVAALKRLDDPAHPAGHGEIKSMRTAREAVRTGVAAALLARLIDLAHDAGIDRISLETGAEPFFAPARRFYARHGFTPCDPFVGYAPDPNSVFLTRWI